MYPPFDGTRDDLADTRTRMFGLMKDTSKSSVFIACMNIATLITFFSMMTHSIKSGGGNSSSNNIRLFEFPWTFRVSTHNATSNDNVIALYKYANVTANTGDVAWDGNLTAVLTAARKELWCQEVQFAQAAWGVASVSPLCNCFENLHAEFATKMYAHFDNATAKDELKAGFKKHFNDFCVKKTRSTITEEAGVYGSAATTNVVLGTLIWNTVATMSSIYSIYFDNFKGPNNQWTYALHILPFAFSMAGLGLYGINTSTGLLLGAVLIFGCVQIVMLGLDSMTGRNQPYALRKSLVHWVGYSINLMLMFTSVNVLMQRRDHYNMLYFLATGFCLGIIGLVSDYVTHIRNTGPEPTKEHDDVYRSTHKYLWGAALLLIAGVSNISESNFVNSPFSNAQACIWFALPVLYIPLLTLPNGWNKLKGDADLDISKSPAPGTFLMREYADLLSRIVFTIAIFTDMASLGNRDNLYLVDNTYELVFPV